MMKRASKKKIGCLSMLLALSMTGSVLSSANAVSPPLSTGTYVPISMEEVRDVARVELRNAAAAGRLTPEQTQKFSAELDSASSLGGVEHTWAELESQAQRAKEMHPSLDHLLTTFSNKLSSWQKQNVVTADQLVWYRDRIKGIQRIKKQLTATDHFFDFWEYATLAIDLSSLNEKINRALAGHEPPLETLNERVMRTDNYIARNELCARMLTVYKSFEVEPDSVRDARERLWGVLKDRANSRMQTPFVKASLYEKLSHIQYESCKILPLESEIDKAIVEVQRLLDSGAQNGNLGAFDDVRLQHELELVKQLKKAYPGPNPGIDPVERELRFEEMRFASEDLRFLQDWLGRVLRSDGESVEAREQFFRVVRRIDLAYYSHRITDKDVTSLFQQLNDALHTATEDNAFMAKCVEIEGRMDMMVSDYSMEPAKAGARLKSISASISKMTNGRDQAAGEKDRIQQILAGYDSMSVANKYGTSIVAAAEAEMLRNRVRALLRSSGVSAEAEAINTASRQ
jgi:hypothetical protein